MNKMSGLQKLTLTEASRYDQVSFSGRQLIATQALHKKGLLEYLYRYHYRITEAGKAALNGAQ